MYSQIHLEGVVDMKHEQDPALLDCTVEQPQTAAGRHASVDAMIGKLLHMHVECAVNAAHRHVKSAMSTGNKHSSC